MATTAPVPPIYQLIMESIKLYMAPLLIVTLLLVIVLWIRSIQQKGGTEVKVYKRP